MGRVKGGCDLVFNTDIDPENSQLKEYFTWRDTAVTKHQQVNLINKIAHEIVMKGKFLAYCTVSEKPEKTEDGKFAFPKGTKISYFSITSKQGQKFLPVFTDREQLAKWKDPENRDKTLMLLTFDDFVPILRSASSLQGIIINPMSDNFPLPRKLVADWMNRKIALFREVLKRQKEKQSESGKNE